MTDAYPELTFESREQWRAWLSENHATTRGVWVTTYKKASGKPHLRIDDLVDGALAHGWIDSRPRTLDASAHHDSSPRAAQPATGHASTNNASSDCWPPAA